MRRLVAQRQERRHRAVEDEPVATGFSGQQELEQKAQAIAVRRAGVQAVEACSTGQAATLQTGTACEDRDEGQTGISFPVRSRYNCLVRWSLFTASNG
jgi:hypothetical protein